MQRLAHLKRCLARLDRVDDVALDGLYVRLGQIACKHVHLGAAHLGTLALADELNAFACRIGTLVELPGKVLDREDDRSIRIGHLGRSDIRLRLAEHGGDALGEQLV